MKNNKINFKKEKGTTLVEVLLSVALLAIIVTPLMGAVMSSIKTNSAAKDKTEAIALVEKVMGEIKAWKVIPVGSGPLPESANKLVPYYEIVLDDSGNVAPSTDTAFNYAITDADSPDFELEINQGTNTDGFIESVTLKDRDEHPIGTQPPGFLVATTGLELIVNPGNNTYEINTKPSIGTGTQIILGRLDPLDATSIKLKVTNTNTAPSSAEQLKIYTSIISNVDNIFKVYVINNKQTDSGVNFINMGTTNFEVNYMDTTHVFDHSVPLNKLFKITVTIKKNGHPIYSTSSYVKK